MIHTSRTRHRKLQLFEVIKSLVAEKMIDADKIDLLQRLDQHQGQCTRQWDLHPFVYITERKWINLRTQNPLSMDDLLQWLSRRCRKPVYRLDPLNIDVPAITNIISKSYARNFNILPVAVTRDKVTIATAEPYDLQWLHEISHLCQKQIKIVLLSPLLISRYIDEFYHVANSVLSAGLQNRENQQLKPQNFEQLLELGRRGELDSNDHHVISIVDWLLQYAFEQRASDIHLEPRREVAYVRFRIDGVLQQVYEIPAVVMAAVSSRIKILARMNVAEKRRPQDGRIKTRDPDNNEIELRLSTMPTAFGEKLVMRIFDPRLLQLDFSALGFSDRVKQQWQQLIEQPHGLLLVTGPTGSGKTSTLYSSLRQLATPEVNVCTIEDPIEMIEPSFNQMQVQEQIDLTFASGVKTLLRQDPDIIMIGEIRDLDTAQMAIQAALTGHLVLSTLHTNDSASAIVRLMDLGVPYYLIQNCVLGVMAQRLVRVLCRHCRQKTAIDEQDWQFFTQSSDYPCPESVYVPSKCHHCRHTGYHGRTGLYEIMPVSQAIRRLLSPRASVEIIQKQALAEGMQTLRDSGIQKVIAGVTTIEEVIKVSQ